jgi:hypothetical protein
MISIRRLLGLDNNQDQKQAEAQRRVMTQKKEEQKRENPPPLSLKDSVMAEEKKRRDEQALQDKVMQDALDLLIADTKELRNQSVSGNQKAHTQLIEMGKNHNQYDDQSSFPCLFHIALALNPGDLKEKQSKAMNAITYRDSFLLGWSQMTSMIINGRDPEDFYKLYDQEDDSNKLKLKALLTEARSNFLIPILDQHEEKLKLRSSLK